ncbi:putative leucine-rich repeat-containing protein DDB_G0290503 isoform X2 [Prorops nasuta]
MLRITRFHEMGDKFDKVWESYKKRYEEIPEFVMMKESEIELTKIRIQYQILKYKWEEEQKRKRLKNQIDWKRTCIAIVEFAQSMLKREHDQKEYEEVKKQYYEAEIELQQIIKKAESMKKLLIQEEEAKNEEAIFKKPLPSVSLSQFKKRRVSVDQATKFEDVISLNSTLLQQMCSKETDSVISSSTIEKIKESEMAIDVEGSSSPQSTIVLEKTVATTETINNVETNVDANIGVKNNDEREKTVPLIKSNFAVEDNNLITNIILNQSDTNIAKINNKTAYVSNFADRSVSENITFISQEALGTKNSDSVIINERNDFHDSCSESSEFSLNMNVKAKKQQSSSQEQLSQTYSNKENENTVEVLHLPKVKEIKSVKINVFPVQCNFDNSSLFSGCFSSNYEFCESEISMDLEDNQLMLKDEETSKCPSNISSIDDISDNVQHNFKNISKAMDTNNSDISVSNLSEKFNKHNLF